jgi:hypothetical protein
MTFKKHVPQVGDIPAKAYKSRKRRIKLLVDYRWIHGPATLFDAHTHRWRYPPDEVAAVLRRIKREASELGIAFQFSTDESKFV